MAFFILLFLVVLGRTRFISQVHRSSTEVNDHEKIL